MAARKQRERAPVGEHSLLGHAPCDPCPSRLHLLAASQLYVCDPVTFHTPGNLEGVLGLNRDSEEERWRPQTLFLFLLKSHFWEVGSAFFTSHSVLLLPLPGPMTQTFFPEDSEPLMLAEECSDVMLCLRCGSDAPEFLQLFPFKIQDQSPQ